METVASTRVARKGATARTRRPPGTPRRRAKVLIVDDSAEIRLLCSLSLEAHGLAVLEAADGRLGLERARAERPDLVLTDVKMPGLDGFELAAALHEDRRTQGIPVIFLSGETLPANERRAKELGALAYLTKPFDPVALATVVGSALGAREARLQ